MTDELFARQLELEAESRQFATERYRETTQASLERGSAENTQVGQYLITSYVNALTQGIKGYLEELDEVKVGRKAKCHHYIKHIEPEVLAFLTLKAITNTIFAHANRNSRSEKPQSVYAVAMFIGEGVHREVRVRKLSEAYDKEIAKILRDAARKDLTRDKTERALAHCATKYGVDWNLWSPDIIQAVGFALLSVFIETTGDASIETVKPHGSKHTVDVLMPSETLVKVLADANATACSLMTVYYPMVYPPRPWGPDNTEQGAYYSPNVLPYVMVKKSRKAYRELIKERAKAGQLDEVFRSLNALQDTPWRVNERVLSVATWAHHNGIRAGKLIPSTPLELPECPPELEHLDRSYPEKLAWLQERAIIHEANRVSMGSRATIARTLALAERFKEFSKIYFPHDLDSRGRAYPKTYGLNPQGPDYAKGLLMFAEALPLGPDGLYWLGVHGANCHGFDKAPLDERYQYAQGLTELAKACAEDPKGNLEWTKADNPVQFLAWCFEWAEATALDDPSAYESRLHVDLDATCSGLQHFAGMLRDAVGGYYVNMTDCPTRQDVYQAVADRAMQLCRERLATEEDEETRGYLEAWLDLGFCRKITKRSVMVKPYAGTYTSCRYYVGEAASEKLADRPGLVEADTMWKFVGLGSDLVWQAIPQIVVAADDAMSWLSTLARKVGLTNKKTLRIEWDAPTGLPVWLHKFNTKSRQIKTKIDGQIYRPRYLEETLDMDWRRMGTSVPPSFVHSMDGAHMMITISRASSIGIPAFAAVHDSFGVHACHVGTFKRIIREAFVDMYSNHDVLGDFEKSVRETLPSDTELPPRPAYGNLDLKGILRNEFFFS